MSVVAFKQVDVFTSQAFKGNPSRGDYGRQYLNI